MSEHPTRDQWISFLTGLETEDSIASLSAHLDACVDCCGTVEALDQDLNRHHRLPLEATPALDITSPPLLAPCCVDGFIGQIDSYPVRSLIARGGMGVVYHALDRSLERDVAIKVLAPELASQPGATERFLREARAAAVADHPNILPVYSVSQDSTPPYIVMAFNDGETLADLLEREGALPVEEAARIGADIARGLAAAHSLNLIHRDIKPANILLSADGKVRIADFGLARGMDAPHITHAGMITGTPLFMAPEQIDGLELDPRADLFSLGVILYYMVSGKHPFDASSTTAIMKRVALDPVPKLEKAPDWFQGILESLLAKAPDQRIQSAKQTADFLESRSFPKISRAKRNLKNRRIAAALLLVGTATGFGTLQKTPEPDTVTVVAPVDETVLAKDWFVTISGKPNQYSTLEEAAQKAPAQATLFIHGTGRIVLPKQHFEKPVRIAAAKGSLPRLEAIDSTVGNLFSSTSHLTLEGLILHQTVTDPTKCLPVIDSAGTLAISNCRIVRVWRGDERIIGAPAVVKSTGKKLAIANSEIYAPSSHVIIARAEELENVTDQRVHIQLANNLLCGSFIVTIASQLKNPHWILNFSHNNFLGGGAVMADFGATPATATFKVQSCVFETNGLYTSPSQWQTMIENVENVSWLGSENLYHVKLFFHSCADNASYSKFVKSFEHWDRMLDPPERDSAVIGTPFAAWLPQDFTIGTERIEVEGHLCKEDFALSPALQKKYPGRGANLNIIGPGATFDHWRETSAYEKWQEHP
ncbi:MAG: serine/threonine protein kinase [Verrucomicrobiae bacterium]|nr:serine/threonine protein kinase [Verrucomicrobiae bacterium]